MIELAVKLEYSFWNRLSPTFSFAWRNDFELVGQGVNVEVVPIERDRHIRAMLIDDLVAFHACLGIDGEVQPLSQMIALERSCIGLRADFRIHVIPVLSDSTAQKSLEKIEVRSDVAVVPLVSVEVLFPHSGWRGQRAVFIANLVELLGAPWVLPLGTRPMGLNELLAQPLLVAHLISPKVPPSRTPQHPHATTHGVERWKRTLQDRAERSKA